MLKKIYIITGEKSGEIIGYNLIKDLKEKGLDIKINGIFGEKISSLTNENSLFDYSKLSVIGFIKPLVFYFYYKYLIAKTVKDILIKQPDYIVFIDCQGFTKFVVEALKKYKIKSKLIKYVVPTFWIYSENRKFWIRDNFDATLCFFPNEVEELNNIGDKNNYFVSNPHISGISNNQVNKKIQRNDFGIKKDTNLFVVVPGSRKSEILKCLPIFLEAIIKLNNDNNQILIPAVEKYVSIVEKIVNNYNFTKKPIIVKNGYVSSLSALADFCFCCSGTASLEVVSNKVPLVVCYKASPITFYIVNRKRTNKSKKFYVNMINIISNEMIVPELVNKEFNKDNLVQVYNNYKNDKLMINKAYDKLRYIVDGNENSGKPMNASDALLEIMK